MRRAPRSRLRAALLTLVPALASGATLEHASVARADDAVSAADREAARNLYKEGYDLQAAGNHGGALERFRRSQKVYPAPTTLLHIAECEAQLLQLVDSAETYRQLVRQQLPPGSPPAFVAAQTQGAAELQQVEPRIPHVRVDVTPASAQGLAVTIDDQPMNTALLGVDRPVDPGEHRIAAVAPGYERAEAVVRIAEREPTRAVSLTLKEGAAGAGAVAVPSGAGGLANGQPQVVYITQPYAGGPTYYVAPPPGTAPGGPVPAGDAAQAPGFTYPPKPVGSRVGLFFGPRVGGVIPYGNTISDFATPGFSLGAEVDLRFARRWYVGAVFDHGFLGTSSSVGPGFSGTGSSVSTSASTTNVDAVIGVMTNPDKFGALFQVGLGYRTLSETAGITSASVDSVEVQLGAGFWIPIGSRVRLSPRIDTSFGTFSGADPTGKGLTGYAMIDLGIGGYYNIDFK